MARAENPVQHIVGDAVWSIHPDVAPAQDGLVDRGNLVWGEVV